jgi:hypothetical protein
MTDDEKKQAEVLAAIAKLAQGTTIDQWNAQRFNVVVPQKQRLQ